MKAWAALVLFALSAGCALDGSRLPDSERLTVDGPVQAAPPAPAAAPPPAPDPVENASRVPPLECLIAALDAPPTIPAGCSSPLDRNTQAAELAKRVVDGPRDELLATLARHAADTTARTFALFSSAPPDDRARLAASAGALLAGLGPGSPRWRAGLGGLAEEADCRLSMPLLAVAGQVWMESAELHPSALYLVSSMLERCRGAVESHIDDADTEAMFRRFGAPLPPSLLGAMLEQYPRAFGLLGFLWPHFKDDARSHRSAEVSARVARFVASAGASVRAKKLVREAVAGYVAVLERSHDERGLAELRPVLRESTRDPMIDVVVGDIVDHLEATKDQHRQGALPPRAATKRSADAAGY